MSSSDIDKILSAIARLAVATPTTLLVSSIPSEPQRREIAERRHVTVLFADMVGSTALSTRPDPDPGAVLRTSAAESQFEALHTGAITLVGREAEIELLKCYFDPQRMVRPAWSRSQLSRTGKIASCSGIPARAFDAQAHEIVDAIAAIVMSAQLQWLPIQSPDLEPDLEEVRQTLSSIATSEPANSSFGFDRP